MNSRSFSLTPFSPFSSAAMLDLPSRFSITGAVGRSRGSLAISFELSGKMGELLIPPTADTPERRTGLWEETCFEFFAGMKGAPRYWEFNLSPSGHWNVFHFSGYRQEMREETAFTSLPFVIRKSPDCLSLALVLDLGELVRPGRDVDIGISAVLKHEDGDGSAGTSYWALTHPGPRADFHRRVGFILSL